MSDDQDEPGDPRGRPFPKGVSGNPGGRPRGSKNRATAAAQLLEESAEEIAERVKALALGGDRGMLALLLKPILRHEPPISFTLPTLHSAADAKAAMKVLLDQAAAGEITLAEAERVARLVEVYLKALEDDDFDHRLRLLEGY